MPGERVIKIYTPAKARKVLMKNYVTDQSIPLLFVSDV